jgi:hypothetical protein
MRLGRWRVLLCSDGGRRGHRVEVEAGHVKKSEAKLAGTASCCFGRFGIYQTSTEIPPHFNLSMLERRLCRGSWSFHAMTLYPRCWC